MTQNKSNSVDTFIRESEKYWNNLSKDEQLKVFCAVSRRIHNDVQIDEVEQDKPDYEFKIGDVEDPHLVAGFHLANKDYHSYRLEPDEYGGWKCLVYRSKENAHQGDLFATS